MDVEWAEGKLLQYLDICAAVRRAVAGGQIWNDEASQLNAEAELMLTVVERIVLEVDPGDRSCLMPPNYSSHDGEHRVRRALGALRGIEELAQHWTKESPDLSADGLHPLVWGAASILWDTGKYDVAVRQVALALATTIGSKSRSRLNDRKLMQDVFSPDLPRPGARRLHFPGDREDESWRSRQLGLQLLAQGAYAGIRNISAHEESDWPESVALEYLTVFSVVARWFDETLIVEG